MLAIIIIIIICQMGNVVVPTSLDWCRTECIGACKMPCLMLSTSQGLRRCCQEMEVVKRMDLLALLFACLQ